ncbi:hypothetical protein JCM9279_002381 [Rhodotorula babjevae]
MDTSPRSRRTTTFLLPPPSTTADAAPRADAPTVGHDSDSGDDGSASAASSSSTGSDDNAPIPLFQQRLPIAVLECIARHVAALEPEPGAQKIAGQTLVAFLQTCRRVYHIGHQQLYGDIRIAGGDAGQQMATILAFANKIEEGRRVGRPLNFKRMMFEFFDFSSVRDTGDGPFLTGPPFLGLVRTMLAVNLVHLTLSNVRIAPDTFKALIDSVGRAPTIKALVLLRVSTSTQNPDPHAPWTPDLSALRYLEIRYCSKQMLQLVHYVSSLEGLVLANQTDLLDSTISAIKDHSRTLKHLSVASNNPQVVAHELLNYFIDMAEEHDFALKTLALDQTPWALLFTSVRRLSNLNRLFVRNNASISATELKELSKAAPKLRELMLVASKWPSTYEAYVSCLKFDNLLHLSWNWKSYKKAPSPPSESPKPPKSPKPPVVVTDQMLRVLGRGHEKTLKSAFFVRAHDDDGTWTGLLAKYARGPQRGIQRVDVNPKFSTVFFNGLFDRVAEECV